MQPQSLAAPAVAAAPILRSAAASSLGGQKAAAPGQVAAPGQAAAQDAPVWFVMRDLSRANARQPAWKLLSERGFEVFTPMRPAAPARGTARTAAPAAVPYVQDLVFVRTTRRSLDPVVAATRTLQYRFQRGHAYQEPMTVPTADMDRFRAAVAAARTPQYYMPGQLTRAMIGRRVRIIAGPLAACEGNLLAVRGARTKRLIVALPELMAVAVEVEAAQVEAV